MKLQNMEEIAISAFLNDILNVNQKSYCTSRGGQQEGFDAGTLLKLKPQAVSSFVITEDEAEDRDYTYDPELLIKSLRQHASDGVEVFLYGITGIVRGLSM